MRAERFPRRLTLTESRPFSLACCRSVTSPQATGAVVTFGGRAGFCGVDDDLLVRIGVVGERIRVEGDLADDEMVLPLSQAAEACFGTSEWPADRVAPRHQSSSKWRTRKLSQRVGFANSGGLVFVDESAEEVAAALVIGRVQRLWVAAVGRLQA